MSKLNFYENLLIDIPYFSDFKVFKVKTTYVITQVNLLH